MSSMLSSATLEGPERRHTDGRTVRREVKEGEKGFSALGDMSGVRRHTRDEISERLRWRVRIDAAAAAAEKFRLLEAGVDEERRRADLQRRQRQGA